MSWHSDFAEVRVPLLRLLGQVHSSGASAPHHVAQPLPSLVPEHSNLNRKPCPQEQPLHPQIHVLSLGHTLCLVCLVLTEHELLRSLCAPFEGSIIFHAQGGLCGV